MTIQSHFWEFGFVLFYPIEFICQKGHFASFCEKSPSGFRYRVKG